MDRGNDHFVRLDFVHEKADGGDVGHRVHRAHFVEVDLVHGSAVYVALGLSNLLINRHHVQRHHCRKAQTIHDLLDVTEPAVVVMMLMFMLMLVAVALFMVVVVLVYMFVLVVMVMVMFMLVIMMVVMFVHVLVFFCAVDGDAHVRAGDAALHGGLRNKLHARDAARIQFLHKGVAVGKKFEKSGGEHVARGAHRAVDVKSLHDFSSVSGSKRGFFASIWLIMLARYPAPNPLSMLTTDTPLAQELSMERSAESPSNAAP